jgi:nucleotide-binding universal stress UspA family protein
LALLSEFLLNLQKPNFMSVKTFIVPHDFTSVADIALEHAIVTAKPLEATIQLLHVVSKESQIPESIQKLEAIVEKHNNQGITIVPNVRIGSIFEDIGGFAAEHMAELIIMGTHGAHGWQHITGSNALKVVTSSPVPFIIVQEKEKKIKPTGYDSIVVPMDLHKETKQKLAVVANLAKYFNSEVHVVTPDESDEYLRNQVVSNITFAQKFFLERGISIKTSIIPSSGFDKEVVKYATSVDADLIAIMNLSNTGLFTLLSSNYEQYIITNDALIPALILNPIETMSESETSSIFSM